KTADDRPAEDTRDRQERHTDRTDGAADDLSDGTDSGDGKPDDTTKRTAEDDSKRNGRKDRKKPFGGIGRFFKEIFEVVDDDEIDSAPATTGENELITSIKLPKKNPSIIMVLGVGGAGGNAVNHMSDLGITDVTFMVCNTDRQ